jgi:hypothetical protein
MKLALYLAVAVLALHCMVTNSVGLGLKMFGSPGLHD